MGQVTVEINGRKYQLICGDGEEARLSLLADHLSLRVDRLAMDFGHAGDARLLVMAALIATDELLELKARVASLEATLAGGPEADAQPRPESEPAAREAATPGPSILAVPTLADQSADPPASAPAAAASPPAPQPSVPRAHRTSLEARLAEARASPGKPAAPKSGAA